MHNSQWIAQVILSVKAQVQTGSDFKWEWAEMFTERGMMSSAWIEETGKDLTGGGTTVNKSVDGGKDKGQLERHIALMKATEWGKKKKSL